MHYRYSLIIYAIIILYQCTSRVLCVPVLWVNHTDYFTVNHMVAPLLHQSSVIQWVMVWVNGMVWDGGGASG